MACQFLLAAQFRLSRVRRYLVKFALAIRIMQAGLAARVPVPNSIDGIVGVRGALPMFHCSSVQIDRRTIALRANSEGSESLAIRPKIDVRSLSRHDRIGINSHAFDG
jgi:hypothetical protein